MDSGFAIDDVLTGTGGTLIGGAPPAGATFRAVSTDSRTVGAGDLFWALAGPRFDGHDYVAQALQAGAAGAVVRRGTPLDEEPPAVAAIVAVEDTLVALGDFAGWWCRARAPRVVAVTGSNGKTTTKELVARVLATHHRVLATRGNLNNLIGLPLTLLGLADEDAVVVEMGMNAPGEIRRLAEIARPEVGVVTQVAAAHLEGLGDLEGVADAKWELVEGLPESGWAVINADDPRLAARAGRAGCRVLSFGIASGDLRATRIEDLGLDGIRFRAVAPDGEEADVRLALLGAHNALNAAAALAVGRILGIPLAEAAEALAAVEPIPGRMVPVRLGRSVDVLDDTYNANPASVVAALAAGARSPGEEVRTIVVLGEMRELGPDAERLHREAGAEVARRAYDLFVAVGDLAAALGQGARDAGLDPERVIEAAEPTGAVDAVVTAVEGPTRVVVKGSRGARMERVVEGLRDRLGARDASPDGG